LPGQLNGFGFKLFAVLLSSGHDENSSEVSSLLLCPLLRGKSSLRCHLLRKAMKKNLDRHLFIVKKKNFSISVRNTITMGILLLKRFNEAFQ